MKKNSNTKGVFAIFIYKNKNSNMVSQDLSKCKVTEKIDVTCDNCNLLFQRTIKNLKKSRNKWNDKDFCISCANILSLYKKPQCQKDYWTDEVRNRHGNTIKSSQVFQDGIKNREDVFGEKNPMFGKTHSVETIYKMSKSRIGKLGENSTAWKGGKSSITRLVKSFQHRNGWYRKIYERDGFRCVKCDSNNKIEAHHIIPIKNIVDKYSKIISNKEELYNFLINLDIIIDSHISNGITLCRECHKKEHSNFGSHFPVIKN